MIVLVLKTLLDAIAINSATSLLTTVLKYNNTNNSFEVLNNSTTGIIIHGDSKDSEIIDLNDHKVILVTNNDGPLTMFKINK